MADPLSAGSGIAGIISLAGFVIGQCYKYGCNVSGAPEEAQRLISEVTGLSGVLVGVQAVVGQSGFVSSQLETQVLQCQKLLQQVASRLRDQSPEGPFSKRKQVLNRMMWPLRKNETEQLITGLDRQKGTLSVLLESLSIDMAVQQQSTLTSVAQGVASLVTESDIKQRQQILEWLSDFDYEALYRRACQLHCPDTCLWLLDHPQIQKWSQSRSSLAWLYGITGSGKTIATTHLIKNLATNMNSRDGLLGYFYYDASTVQTLASETFFGTLLKQFCSQLAEIPPKIVESYINASRRSSPPKQATEKELISFINGILGSGISRATIIIDGLDESSHTETVCQFLVDSVRSSQYPTQIFVSSRPEIEIRNWFNEFRHIPMPENSIEQDMSVYISSRMSNHPRLKKVNKPLKDYIEQVLRNDSHGMFRWVQCQMDEISKLRTDRAIKEALRQLPPSLEDSYGRILQNIKPADIEYAQHALLWCAHVLAPLSLAELAEAATFAPDLRIIDPDTKLNQETDVLEICGSLLAYNEISGEVRIAHHSVREYLTTRLHPGSPFAIPNLNSHHYLAIACLNYLLLDDFSQGPLFSADFYYTLKHFPLLTYAASNWVAHVQQSSSEGELQPLIMELMSVNVGAHFRFWLQIVLSVSRHGFVDPVQGLTKVRPLYYAASYGLLETVRSLIHAGAEVDERAGRFGGTALHAACWRKHPEIARSLLEAGADVLLQDGQGATPADFAMMSAKHELKDIIRQYEKKARRDALYWEPESSSSPSQKSEERKGNSGLEIRTKLRLVE